MVSFQYIMFVGLIKFLVTADFTLIDYSSGMADWLKPLHRPPD